MVARSLLGSNGVKKIFNLFKNKFVELNEYNDGVISATKYISNDANGFILSFNNKRVFLRLDENNFWILISDPGSDSFNGKRPFCLSTETGECVVNGSCTRAYQDRFGNDIDISSTNSKIDNLITRVQNLENKV